MKLHPRTMRVQRATAKLKSLILDWAEDNDLTDVEMVGALAVAQQMFITSLLRAERHLDDPSRKADEA